MLKLYVICLILISLLVIEASERENENEHRYYQTETNTKVLQFSSLFLRFYSAKIKTVAKSFMGSNGMQNILNRQPRAAIATVIEEDKRPCTYTSLVYGCMCRVGDRCNHSTQDFRKRYDALKKRYHD